MVDATTAGFYTNGVPQLDALLATTARMPADTGLSDGRAPQTVALQPAQVAAGVVGYSTPLTGFAITIPDGVSKYLIIPAGTLATGAFTLPANPIQGQELWIGSSQTQTACTVAASTGSTIVGTAVTALTASIMVGYVYIGTVWYRIQ